MGNNRSIRDSMSHNNNGFPPEAYADDYGYPDEPPSREVDAVEGFVRHQSNNRRHPSSENLISAASKRIGESVSNLVGNRSKRQQAPSRPARASSSSAHDDYLGVGAACHVCGKPVGPAQARCPHCGAFIKPLYQNIVFWIAIVVFVALIVVLSIAINSCNSTRTPSKSEQVTGNTTQQTSQENDTTIDRASLSAAVESAQEILSNQSATHTYTRYSAATLQSAVDDANALLLNGTATDDQIRQAYQELSDANAGLTERATNYETVAYADLTADFSNYLNRQIALSGTALIVTHNDNGTVSVQMAVDGDSNAIAYVDYLPEDATGDLVEGESFIVNGTVSYEAYGSPVIQADYIQVQ